MNSSLKNKYIDVLRSELCPALGCTEPIAIAYAAAAAREILGRFPTGIAVACSGNVIKSVDGVTVPNSGGLHGVDIAATLGVVCGDPHRKLEVLSVVDDASIMTAQELVSKGFCKCSLAEGVENLYIKVNAFADGHNAGVTISNAHTRIVEIVKDGEALYASHDSSMGEKCLDKSFINVKDILDFADSVEASEVSELLDMEIVMNSKISDAGLATAYGAQVGRTLLETYGDSVDIRARAKAAAGSDARMGGCSLPVVINSGSGNQGLVVSLPVIEYARELKASKEKLYKALLVSNLVSIHIKSYIGSLSAFCGAVSAACGAGAAITYLYGGSYEDISCTITNTLANVSGMICDGAKPACAAKISSALEAAILAHSMTMKHRKFQSGEGIIRSDLETTIKGVGYVGREGMKDTDSKILNVMLNTAKLDSV